MEHFLSKGVNVSYLWEDATSEIKIVHGASWHHHVFDKGQLLLLLAVEIGDPEMDTSYPKCFT